MGASKNVLFSRRAGRVLLAVLMMRVAVGCVLAIWELLAPTPQHSNVRYYHDMAPHLSILGQLFVKWDSYWYLNIAAHGYDSECKAQGQSNLAFAPLYPAAISLLEHGGIPSWVSGMLVSLICYLGLLAYLFVLGTTLQSEELGERLIIFVSAFPSAWVLHMVYSEAMFCLCLTAALAHYVRGQFGRAGLWAIALPGVRVAGLALLPALTADLGFQLYKHRRINAGWITLLGSAAGVAGLHLFYWRITGNPTAYASAGQAWFSAAAVDQHSLPLVHSFGRQMLRTPIAALCLFFFVLYALLSFRVVMKNRDAAGWFGICYFPMLLRTPFVTAQMRYLLPLIPVHVVLSRRLSNRMFFVVVLLLLVTQVLLTRLQLTWWVII